jgi:hypothetical protein
MKRPLAIIFLAIGLSAHIQVPSQMNVYHSFPGTSSGAFWRADWSDAAFCMNLSAVYQYYYSNDTLIGPYVYHKVMKSGGFVGGCYDGTPFGYQGSIREDTSARKVLIILPNQTNENVLYDFTLNIGDTLKTVQDSLFYTGSCIVVGSIDSILIGSTYRKKWNFNSTCVLPFPIIEGIGSLGGLIDPLGVFERGATLICYNDTGIHFDNPFYGSPFGCDTVYQAVHEIPGMVTVYLFPIPADNTLNIEFSTPTHVDIIVTDIYGRKILQQVISDNEVLNVSGIPQGIYFLSSANNEFPPMKFMIIHE